MAELLTAQEVQERFGISRASLLRYEDGGKLSDAVVRTPGGQRRYKEEALQRILRTSSPTPPNYGEIGDSGLSRWGGHVVQDDELVELRGQEGIKLFREMRLNDPVISAIFFGIENSIKQATPRVAPASEKSADKDAADFVDRCLHDMSLSFNDTMDFVCDCLTVGVAPLEISYKRRLGDNPPNYTADPGTSQYVDGKVGWRKWSLRPVDTLSWGDEFVFDKHGTIQGIHQDLQTTGEKVTIPIEKLLLFRTTVAPFNSPLPPPIHRSAYVPYYFAKNFQEIEGIGVERDLGGIPVIYLGSDCTSKDFDVAKQLVVNLRRDEQAGIVVPHAKMGYGANDGQGMLIELLSSANTRSHDIGIILDRLDKRKSMVVLAQFIMLGMDRYGSYALSKTQSDLFTIAVTAWLHKFADIINMYAIPRLIRYNNFPDITGYPKLKFSTVGVPDLTGISTFVNAMVGREVITPDPELERHMRHVAGLPDPQPVTVDGQRVTKPKPTGETALLIRRILLALKELPTYEGMSDEALMAMMEPLLEQLRVGVERESGLKVPAIADTGLANPEQTQLRSDVDTIMARLQA